MKPIVLKGHERSITHVTFNREGDLLFSCSKDTKPCVWYSDTGERIGTYNGHNGAIWFLDVSDDSSRLLTASADTSVKFWDVQTGTEIWSLQHRTPVRCVGFSLGSKQFFSVTDSVMGGVATILIYNLDGDQCPDAPVMIIEVPGSKINQARWGPMNTHIYAACGDGYLRIFDSQTGELVHEINDHTKSVTGLQFDKEKITFITSSKDGRAILYDTKTFKLLKMYDTGRPINSAAISPLKDHIAAGGGQSAEGVTQTRVDSIQLKLRFFHKIHEEEFGTIAGHFGPVNVLSFSPDGKSICSGAEDGYVRINQFDEEYFKLE